MSSFGKDPQDDNAEAVRRWRLSRPDGFCASTLLHARPAFRVLTCHQLSSRSFFLGLSFHEGSLPLRGVLFCVPAGRRPPGGGKRGVLGACRPSDPPFPIPPSHPCQTALSYGLLSEPPALQTAVSLYARWLGARAFFASFLRYAQAISLRRVHAITFLARSRLSA